MLGEDPRLGPYMNRMYSHNNPRLSLGWETSFDADFTIN
jgi:hypothetical protein